MGLRTPAEFLAGLKDGREVYYRGERVASVPDHPELGVVARHVAIDFELAEDGRYAELAQVRDGNEVYSAYYRVPRNSGDLLSRSQLIAAATAEGATLVILIKEIGTDALFALMRVLARSGHAEGALVWTRFTISVAIAILLSPSHRPTSRGIGARGLQSRWT